MRNEIVLVFAALLTCEAQNAPSHRLRRDAEPGLTKPPGDNTRDCALVLPAIEAPAITDTTGNQPFASPSYTNCHILDQEQYCLGSDGGGVPAALSSRVKRHSSKYNSDHAHYNEVEVSAGGGCHFHAGVEHCVGVDKPTHACARSDHKYSIPLRIGATFTVLITSSIAVLGPILLKQVTKMSVTSLAFTLIKQFGAGVIAATAFVHLLTHAQLLFGSECIGNLKYEGTAPAITMAGVFLAFLMEYLGARYISRRNAKSTKAGGAASIQGGKEVNPLDEPPGQRYMPLDTVAQEDKLNVGVMESGIIFHSILIGVTLVVTGDSGFISLFIVIIFHQMFEGLALGARIASLHEPTTMLTKLIMAGAFGAITPLGMAIGIGVRNNFNGNDRATLITLGTLDALSAGILIWVALVEMLAADWLHGDLKNSGINKTALALAALACGMALMGLLGKWA